MEKIKIERYLLDKGIPPYFKGFRYLTTALMLCEEDETYLYKLTTKLYPKVAETFSDTTIRTERALRTAIESVSKSYTNGMFLGTALIELRELEAKGNTICLKRGKNKDKQ